MWHCPHVVGRRAIATELVCRVWHTVHVPIVPSSFGLPTLWHEAQPLWADDEPSSATKGCGGRFVAPGWNRSEKSTCSGVNDCCPYTAAQAGAAWRLRRNSW